MELLNLPVGVVPTGIHLETIASVDDILVSTSEEGLCFFNVKSTVHNSANPESPLGSILDQFVRLWLECRHSDGSKPWNRPLDPQRDRLVLITGPRRSARFTNSFSTILARIVDHDSLEPVEAIAKTQTQRDTLKTVLCHLGQSARRHTGKELPDHELTMLLSMVRAKQLDPDGMDKTNCLALLEGSVIESPADADRAWLEIVADCQRMAVLSSGSDRAGLRSRLSARGVALVGPSDMAADARRLKGATEEALASLAHLARLYVSASTGMELIEIERSVTRVLTEQAPSDSMLVTGEPGSGKSGAIFSAAQRLISDNLPVVVISVDRHPVTTSDALRRDLRLENGLVDVLRNWPEQQKGVLFIDALDATRGGPSDSVFTELIRRVIEEAPNWSVVASIRAFDLRFGFSYRGLFRGTPVDPRFTEHEFGNIRHLSIPNLTDGELNQVWYRSQAMEKAYGTGTGALRQLLRSPLNLFLLADVLSAGHRDLTRVSTQLELLHLYWSRRVTGSDRQSFAKEGFLRSALAAMLERHQLSVSVRDIPNINGSILNQLLSEGVLLPAAGHGDQVLRIAFSHHVLFDYAVSRLVFEGGTADDLATRLSASDEDALLLAPAATLAFQILWQDGSAGRPEFWAKALELAGAEGSGTFCRLLPARVAANLTRSADDFQPILDCLATAGDPSRPAALFLAQHCIGVLIVGASPSASTPDPLAPWPLIAEALAEVAIEDTRWMLKPLISRWIEPSVKLNADQRRHIGAAARRMLSYSVGEAYDEHVVGVAIRGIARTFEGAPDESLESLASLLRHERVRQHGHSEISWLAREFEHLLRYVPTTSRLVGDVYRAGYCTPLPSSKETTSLTGSRILGLISTKLQDFVGARYELYTLFPRYFNADPEMATETLVDLVECVLEVGRESEQTVEEFVVSGEHARYLSDRIVIGTWAPDEETGPPLRQFESALTTLVDEGRVEDIDRALSVVVRRNRSSSVWAAVLRAGRSRPDVLGARLLDVAIAKPMLQGFDTHKTAEDLLSVLHPLLDEAGRMAIEEAVLDGDGMTREVLLGRLRAEDLVSREARAQKEQIDSRDMLTPDRRPVEVQFDTDAKGNDQGRHEAEVGVESTENASLGELIAVVEGLGQGNVERSRRLDLIRQDWLHAENLRSILESREDISTALLMSGWNALATVAGAVTMAARERQDLAPFPGVVEIILGALVPSFWPQAVNDAEKEQQFAASQAYEPPVPRVRAARALMGVCRADPGIDPRLAELVELLARDPSPAVRLEVLGNVNMISRSNKPLTHRLCGIGFSEEPNEGVLSFFLRAIESVLQDRPAWFSERLLALKDRSLQFRTEESRSQRMKNEVWLVIRLWLGFDQSGAKVRVREWIADPIANDEQIRNALRYLREAIVLGDPGNLEPEKERARAGAIELYQGVTLHLASTLSTLPREPDRIEPEHTRTAEKALSLLSLAANGVYFGSGAHEARKQQSDGASRYQSADLVRARFFREMEPTMGALATVPHPVVTHRLVETLEPFIANDPKLVFRMVTDALLKGGPSGEYQSEKMGADLFVSIVRRYLAEYRGVLIADPELRQRLMLALDAFAEVGWPSALRLVHELPEALR